MRLRVLAATAVASLAGHRLRSGLSVLGIIIGVAAVIAMLAIGTGAEQFVLADLRAQGSNIIFAMFDGHQPQGQRIRKRQFTLADAEAIIGLPGVRAVSPEVGTHATSRYRERTHACTLNGIVEVFPQVRKFQLAQGRHFTRCECADGSPVAILGATVADELFPSTDPIGEVIQVASRQLTVVGVWAEKDKVLGNDPNDIIHVPLGTALRGLVPPSTSFFVAIEVAGTAVLADVEDAIGVLLLQRHGIARSEHRDFTIISQQEILRQVQRMTGVFTALLGGIAAISLFVGGIGIMNIMLVSVVERTREIGVRKAVGASDADIRNQFLFEAVATSLVGGCAGSALGWGLSLLAGVFMPFKPMVTPGSTLLALSFSVAIGIFFGWYPARRASRLDPIEALRYE